MLPTHDRGQSIDEIARALVRPVVTVIFAGGFLWFTWIGLIGGDVFAGAALTVISFWFASRNQDKLDAQTSALQQSMMPTIVAQAVEDAVDEKLRK